MTAIVRRKCFIMISVLSIHQNGSYRDHNNTIVSDMKGRPASAFALSSVSGGLSWSSLPFMLHIVIVSPDRVLAH